MFYKNARIFCADHQFRLGAFQVVNGRFGAVLPEEVPADAVDLCGATVIPGLIDIHTHGCCGADFSDGDYEGLLSMAKYYARAGVTSFCPASMTLPYEDLEKAFGCAQRLASQAPEGCAVLRGIQMEGPYFSHARRGAQNPEHLKAPDLDGFSRLQAGCGGLVRIVGIASELPGAMEFIKNASQHCAVAVAHTDCDYDRASDAFDAGATVLTHLFNAMPGLHHRYPGPIAAAAERETVRAELICDGQHVHPAMVRLAFSLFGQRVILISDSGRCCGMPEGSRFILGGQEATLSGGIARLNDGTIACSAANLFSCMVNTIAFGVKEELAVAAATYNPACAIGAEGVVGSIEPGKRADFLVCSKDYSRKTVFLAGKAL